MAFPLVMIALLALAGPVPAQPIQPEAPRVVRAVPDMADVGVDPSLTEVRIEFDRDMRVGSNSVCGGGPTALPFTDKPRWDGKRTCILPVRLEPSHRYDLSINCPSARGFVSEGGQPAEAYPISFMTGSGAPDEAPATLTPQQRSEAVKALRAAINNRYSYRDLRGVDWDAVFREHAPALEQAQTLSALARAAAKLLGVAKDVHITVGVGPFTVPTHRYSFTPNFNIEALQKQVPGWSKPSDAVFTGRFDDGVGYVLIATWDRSREGALAALGPALDSMKDVPGLVVDVRPNGGGDESLARQFAGRFVTEPRVYSRSLLVNPSQPGAFNGPFDRTVERVAGGTPFAGKVAVLIGPANMSSCESFIMMMKQAPRVRTFGGRTGGSSGNPKPVSIAPGVEVRLPSWKDLLPDGTVLEGRGIEPDEPVETTPEQLRSGDPVLDAALKWLRS